MSTRKMLGKLLGSCENAMGSPSIHYMRFGMNGNWISLKLPQSSTFTPAK